jgi:hypothetical protein
MPFCLNPEKNIAEKAANIKFFSVFMAFLSEFQKKLQI